MAKRIPWQDLDNILAKTVQRSCQHLTKISMEDQPGMTIQEEKSNHSMNIVWSFYGLNVCHTLQISIT